MRWLLYVWTFPCCLMALVNRRETVGVRFGRKVHVHRWWFSGRRFAFASWPDIYVGRTAQADDRRLMSHEDRHLQQQAWVGGPVFLLTYGLSWAVLFIVKAIAKPGTGPVDAYRDGRARPTWERAYRAIPWEVDARAYARKR